MIVTSPRPPDPGLLAETVQTRLPFSTTLSNIVPLPGDASNRRYFRLQLIGERTSVILMQLASPEAFKQSEEAVTGSVPITELPFINILGHLAKADVPVPALYHFDAEAGLLYLQDFGDLTLVRAYQDGPAATQRELYREAIQILAQMQLRASTPDPTCLAFTRGFDVPLLMWEFDHFLEYGVEARHGTPMRAQDRELVRAEFQKISEWMAAQPRVFTHRDYHSRNLMVRADPARWRLGVIDFQDALLGPATYDLASLLRDAYIELEESMIDELIDYYRELMMAARKGSPVESRHASDMDRREFRRLFDYTSIQRNLKAAGRFVYIDRVKQNPSFLRDIPRTLGYVRRNLSKYPELGPLRTHLAPYVPELQ
jgi:aminoglycoside/choline kinase family phosphotransferase